MPTDTAVNNCLKKKRYYNERIARHYARRLTKKTGIIFEPYKCNVCYWHHLTTLGYKDESAPRY